MSLLIKSDGHPNVVRYFVKEECNDFVYLGLQLCVMSVKYVGCCVVATVPLCACFVTCVVPGVVVGTSCSGCDAIASSHSRI